MLDFLYYLLLASILLDNYRATNLVNSKDLLNPRLFIKVAINKYIKTRLSSLLILGQETHVIKRVLDSTSGLATTDLILKNIVVVKGFYINIISEACLY